MKQLDSNTYTIRVGTGSEGKRKGLRTILFTIRKNKELYMIEIDKRQNERNLTRFYHIPTIQNLVNQSIISKTRIVDNYFIGY